MSLTLAVRCDVCKDAFVSKSGESDNQVRNRARDEGWRYLRAPYQDGTAMLDICPSCEKPQRLTRVK